MPRQIIVKVISVAGITIGLLIPLTMIRGLIQERSLFREQARTDIAESWTGAQNVLGPVLTVPFAIEDVSVGVGHRKQTKRILLPEELRITASLRTERRKRGLYSVPVYHTQLQIVGSFDVRSLAGIAEADPRNFLEDATLAIAISDNRGIAKAPVLTWDGQTKEFRSGCGLPGVGNGVRSTVGIIDPLRSTRYAFRIDLELRGMESISFAPVGRDTRVTLDAAWPHPSFTGRFLPVEYSIEDGGFQAEWSVSHLATNPADTIARLSEASGHNLWVDSFGVSLITPVDVYQQASRSVKYGSLFVILTFTAFFLVEISRKLMFHAMQYLLIGMALVIFFLLLLSLSEHLPFGVAYLVAAVACIGLVGTYLSSSLGRMSSGLSIVAVLSGLYGMLYAILKSEDNALLMGSLLLFVALAAVMIVTRKLDWYKLASQIGPAKTNTGGVTPEGSSTSP